ncbi:hypothetical protein ACEPPN_007077 [Leptodophora sp. 'Broadleaf-Isolate-01']
MHVLFAPPMLLQALDLLDRGLVSRVIEEVLESRDQNDDGGVQDVPLVPGEGEGTSTGERGGGGGGGGDIFPPQANIHLPSTTLPDSPSAKHHQTPTKPRTKPKTTLHQVRSSQPPKSRFRDASSSSVSGLSGSNIYTVRLEAWNCSCAAFAFASFPAVSVYPLRERAAWDLDLNLSWNDEDVRMDGFEAGLDHGRVGGSNGSERGGEGDGEEKWEFGGLSMDGRDGGGLPCCKHLLACVLGERWDVLRGYVDERVVGREEMAGLGCDG